MDEVFRELKSSKEGLTNEEGQKRLEVFGFNKLEEKKAIHIIFQLVTFSNFTIIFKKLNLFCLVK